MEGFVIDRQHADNIRDIINVDFGGLKRFAEILGMSRTTLNNALNSRVISLEVLWRIITILNMPNLWPDQVRALGVATLGDSLLRRGDGVIISEDEQIALDMRLRRDKPKIETPAERLIKLQSDLILIIKEIDSITKQVLKREAQNRVNDK